jgi:UDP-N-acetylmuramoylalanine--D-glutamate ligase
VLNLAPDHLDRYDHLDDYFAAKRKLAEVVPAGGTFITWTACPEARAWSTRGRRVLFGEEASDADVFYREGDLWSTQSGETRPLVAMVDLALQSPPNLLNALAGAAIGLALDLDPDAVGEGLQNFPGLAHRHQLVARRGAVKFINDTKATNVHAVCAGLAGFPDPVVLIVGGSGKGEDYSPLSRVMDMVRHVVLIGEEGPAIGRALEGLVPMSGASSMDEAVSTAADLAEPDGAVLLSPACASFDMFANYVKRGEAFTAAAVKAGAEESV